MFAWRKLFAAAAAIVLLATVSPARAATSRLAMIPPAGDAGLCLAAVKAVGTANDLPPYMLHAIALVESGLWRSGPGVQVPWPWTVTVNGDGRYFETPRSAAEYIRGLLRDGVTNIDVGCMQINLRYHGLAFSSIEEALSPVNNVAYAVAFLKALKKREGDWGKAVRLYHSSDWRLGSMYRARVLETWTNLRQTGASIKAAQLPARALPRLQPEADDGQVVAAIRTNADGAPLKETSKSIPVMQSQRSYAAQKRAQTAAWSRAMSAPPSEIAQ